MFIYQFNTGLYYVDSSIKVKEKLPDHTSGMSGTNKIQNKYNQKP